MNLWGRIFAAMYDRMMAGTEKAGLTDRRKQLLGQARGRVLEIGGGTGANLALYPDSVGDLVIVEPEEPMARRLEQNVAARGGNAQVVRASAESLPFEDSSFDVVVSTLVLCTVSDQKRSLAEIHRVLKPNGRLLFIEHVRADEPGLARWQDRLAGINRAVAHGCNCNRDTLGNLTAAGFTVANVEHDRLQKVPPWIRPLIVGVAEPVPG